MIKITQQMKQSALNLDVRFRTPEQLALLEKFKRYCNEVFGPGNFTTRVHELIAFDVEVYQVKGLPLNLSQIPGISGEAIKNQLSKEVNQKLEEFKRAYQDLGIDAATRMIELATADIYYLQHRGTGLETMRVQGSSIGDNLPKDEDQIKKILEYLEQQGMQATRDDYEKWLLLSEPDGFERGAKCPRFSEIIAIANFLYPKSPRDIDEFGDKLYRQDRERETAFHQEKELKLYNNLSHRSTNSDITFGDFAETLES